jgi:hypothetical protein
MFIAAIFTITNYGNNSDVLKLKNGLGKKYIYIMEFYSAIRKNETMWFETKWMELKNIILSEVSQVQKAKGHMFSLIWGRQTHYKYKQYLY